MSAMVHDDVKALVERYRVGWFEHDVDAIMAVVSADIVFHNLTANERVEGAGRVPGPRRRDP